MDSQKRYQSLMPAHCPVAKARAEPRSKNATQQVAKMMQLRRWQRQLQSNLRCRAISPPAEINMQITGEIRVQAKQQIGFDSVVLEGYGVET